MRMETCSHASADRRGVSLARRADVWLVLVLDLLPPTAPPPLTAGSSTNTTSVGTSILIAATGVDVAGVLVGGDDDERAPTNSAITSACTTIEATTQRTPHDASLPPESGSPSLRA